MKTKLLLLAFAFLSLKGFAQIAEYDFDNTLNNNAGTAAFAATPSLTFTADRHNNATGALSINGEGTTATIPNLPIGSSARTISIWVKSALAGANNYIFSYGNIAANAACGLSKVTQRLSNGASPRPTYYDETSLRFFGWGNDLKQINPTIPTTWTHYVTTYSATGVASIYINGALIVSDTKAGWNTANTDFRLGQFLDGTNNFTGQVDDLKIYDSALSAAQIASLYNLNSIEAAPVISEISTMFTGLGTKIDYKLNANGLSTSSVINYGLSAAALSSQVAVGSDTGLTDNSLTATLTGLATGTTYYYQIVATNSKGTTSSAVLSFVNDATPALAEYDFNNVMTNKQGANSFSTSMASFVNDRNGNPTSAMRLINTTASVNLSNIPTGAAPRTFSIWVKIPNTSQDNYIFHYGGLATNRSYGLTVQGSNLLNFGYANDVIAAGYGVVGPNWVHVVTTFDGTTAKIYHNGVERASANKSGWNTTYSGFTLGKAFDLTVDELKIYNKALNATEVSNLHNFGTIIAPTGLPPVISNISVDGITDKKATLNFTIDAKFNGTVSYSIKYSTDQNFATGNGIVAGQTTTKTSAGGSIAENVTGLSANTMYYYKIIAESGTTNVQRTESTVGDFTTIATPPLSAIAEFKFDNSYASEQGSTLFGVNPGTSFTADRAGNQNSALNINNSGSSATIPNLPYGSASRSISVWAKTNVMNNQINYIFHYGNSANGNGLAFRPGTILFFANANANLELANTNLNNTWVHYVTTYDGTTAKVYKDGVLFSEGAKTFNTVNNTDIFKLGISEGGQIGYFNGAIDDLKIFDKELSAAQVLSLYQNNALTSAKNVRNTNFNINIHPNTVSDKVVFENISETTQKAIYNLQGVRMLESYENSIAVSHLPAGIYIVKFSLANNAVGYGRFVKK